MSFKRTGLAALTAIAAAFSLTACDQSGGRDAPAPTPAVSPAAATLDLYFFQAEGCIYSEGTEPTLQAFIANPANAGRVRLIQVKREEHPELFATYDVDATPTLIFTRGGTDHIVARIDEAAGTQDYLEGIVRRAEAALGTPSPLLALAAEQHPTTAPSVTAPPTRAR